MQCSLRMNISLYSWFWNLAFFKWKLWCTVQPHRVLLRTHTLPCHILAGLTTQAYQGKTPLVSCCKPLEQFGVIGDSPIHFSNYKEQSWARWTIRGSITQRLYAQVVISWTQIQSVYLLHKTFSLCNDLRSTQLWPLVKVSSSVI